MIEWSKDPKQSVMSPSMNHTVPRHWRWTSCKAV